MVYVGTTINHCGQFHNIVQNYKLKKPHKTASQSWRELLVFDTAHKFAYKHAKAVDTATLEEPTLIFSNSVLSLRPLHITLTQATPQHFYNCLYRYQVLTLEADNQLAVQEEEDACSDGNGDHTSIRWWCHFCSVWFVPSNGALLHRNSSSVKSTPLRIRILLPFWHALYTDISKAPFSHNTHTHTQFNHQTTKFIRTWMFRNTIFKIISKERKVMIQKQSLDYTVLVCIQCYCTITPRPMSK
jgi:hypothetical protein